MRLYPAAFYHPGVSLAPLTLSLPLAVVLGVVAVAAAVVAARGFAGSLPRTSRLGVHTPAALASDASFEVANRVAAPIAAGAAVVAAVLAVLVVALPLGWVGALTIGIIGIAGSFALLVAAGVVGDRAARQVPVPARRPGGGAGGGCGGCACGGGGCAGLSRVDPAATGQA